MSRPVRPYFVAYWLRGLTSLPVPDSRVLYALYPGVSLLLGAATDWQRERRLAWGLSRLAVAGWLVANLVSVLGWVASGRPRESGSWRGSFCVIDSQRIYRALAEKKTDLVFASYWTASPLAFSSRAADRRDPQGPPLRIHMQLPPRGLSKGVSWAFVLIAGSPLERDIEGALHRLGIPFERSAIEQAVILWGNDAADIHAGNDLPARLNRGAWPAHPARADGFNWASRAREAAFAPRAAGRSERPAWLTCDSSSE